MKQHGVTLIELMIVVLIVGLLAVVASPFTNGWVMDARVAEGTSVLEDAIGRAKAAAMRNMGKITDDAPASRLCFSDSKVKLVVPASPTQELKCELTSVWSADVSKLVTVKVANIDWSCSCFTNKGLPTKSGVCAACSDSLTFQFFHSGAEREKHSFY